MCAVWCQHRVTHQLVVWIQRCSYSSCGCDSQEGNYEVHLHTVDRSFVHCMHLGYIACLHFYMVFVTMMQCSSMVRRFMVKAWPLRSGADSDARTVLAFAMLTVSPGLTPLIRSKFATYAIRCCKSPRVKVGPPLAHTTATVSLRPLSTSASVCTCAGAICAIDAIVMIPRSQVHNTQPKSRL